MRTGVSDTPQPLKTLGSYETGELGCDEARKFLEKVAMPLFRQSTKAGAARPGFSHESALLRPVRPDALYYLTSNVLYGINI